MRILDGLNIPYETAEYEDDGEHELAKGAALMMSQKLGVPPETVFKTIVMRTETKEICVFCQCATDEINLKFGSKIYTIPKTININIEKLMGDLKNAVQKIIQINKSIIQPLIDIDDEFGQLLKKTYSPNLRNSFAHSLYHIDMEQRQI